VLAEHDDLSIEGYVVQALGGGDFAVRIRHDGARRIALDG
jgi:translation initiation factor IF-1